MSDETILVGAVAYDPKVVTIWEGIRAFFSEQGVAMDFALYSNYERQVESLIAGHIDIAWNTPLAHVRVQERTQGRSVSVCRRDSDRDFHSKVLIRTDSGIRAVADLAGKTVAVGSRDSTQARILPLFYLRQAGVDVEAVKVVAFDTDVGKHGDTGTSELEVLRALHDGRVQAGVIGDLVWIQELSAGRVNTGQVESLWTTPPFDHCMFDALADFSPEKMERFRGALYSMSWDNPAHRHILELEGLKQWVPPREEGYESLRLALAQL
jgi:phosphonate transport system substrate-binding protein